MPTTSIWVTMHCAGSTASPSCLHTYWYPSRRVLCSHALRKNWYCLWESRIMTPGEHSWLLAAVLQQCVVVMQYLRSGLALWYMSMCVLACLSQQCATDSTQTGCGRCWQCDCDKSSPDTRRAECMQGHDLCCKSCMCALCEQGLVLFTQSWALLGGSQPGDQAAAEVVACGSGECVGNPPATRFLRLAGERCLMKALVRE